jgi:regulatory protein
LRRVLARRVDRWARAAEQAGEADVAPRAAAAKSAIAEIARKLAAAGTVDDAAFAESRARRLLRTGRSRRAALAHLAQKGVDAETAAAALPEGAESELDAALAFCRRRRIGPFARAATDAEARRKALAALARGGFAHGVARRALAMDPTEAEDRLLAARRS